MAYSARADLLQLSPAAAVGLDPAQPLTGPLAPLAAALLAEGAAPCDPNQGCGAGRGGAAVSLKPR